MASCPTIKGVIQMSINSIIFLILIGALIIFFIIALKKKWIGSTSGGIFTSQVIMHDLAIKDKQKAMEYIIENQEDLDKRKGDSGEGPEGGKYLDEQ
jgi:hypothetical protein